MDKDKKPPKSPALHGSPSDKKSKSNSKETPTKSRKRNHTESEERTGDFEQTNKRKKNNSNSAEDLDNNDESNDNFEDKAIKTEDEREEEKPQEPPVQVKNEMQEEKPVEPDPLKLTPRSPAPPIPVNPEPLPKEEIIEPDEEPPKLPAHTEPPEEPEKVMTIDPKTGLIGADTSPPVPILNIPTKVIVDEPKPAEIVQPTILIPPPPQSTPLPASKGMSIIVPQPTFLNQPKISPGNKLPQKPIMQEPINIKVNINFMVSLITFFFCFRWSQGKMRVLKLKNLWNRKWINRLIFRSRNFRKTVAKRMNRVRKFSHCGNDSLGRDIKKF